LNNSSEEKMKRFDCLAIGDLLFVLRAPNYATLERTKILECLAGSAEPNVLTGLSRFGLKTALLSKVCDNFIGRWLVDSATSLGIDTSRIVWTNRGRMGIMYVESGAPPRASRVVYDREGSAITTLSSDEIDWEYFDLTDTFYVTGITPALGEDCRNVVQAAVKRAKTNGKRVFFDLNFRRQLWNAETARPFLDEVLPYVDVFFVKPADSREIFGTSLEPDQLADALKKRYQVPLLVISLGEQGALAYETSKYESKSFPTQVLNRFGVGDAFVAGFLYCLLTESDLQRALDFGCACAALKGTIPNENYPLLTKKQVEALLAQRENDQNEPSSIDVLR
jgi:2-dehydro-3-deoxygluconokinase